MPANTMTSSEPAVNGFGPQSLPTPGDDDDDSLSSLSDNLSIWIDGEEHWISGVDASTTCADLICALISYQSVQQDTLPKEDALAARLGGLEPSQKHPAQTPQEFAIVQKQRHYEEYLDGSARLFDVITSRHALPKEECQLQLRHLAISTRKHTPTTDKDSGMGSPVDSSRSMRFRRRGRHKVLPSTKTAESTSIKQPKRSRKLQQRNHQHITPNESLLNIILAQDETILQQMSMLHEKDRQILKIEEEKHRVRERELGKNYLLETYLKDLDEPQENGPEDREVFEEEIQRLHEDDKDYRPPNDGDTAKDEICLYWLEKIHAVNKQLQREEELLLSLHAKVRRHQVKRAYQTKSEVLLQIDRLDTELAAQVSDIHRVERKLFTANEQLKAKLGVLECLGREFETTVSRGDPEAAAAESDETDEAPQSPSVDIHQSGNRTPVLMGHTRRRVTQQELTDRNLKDRLVPDKGLSKQMFKVSTSPDPPTPTVLRREFSLSQVPKTDIQHLGTLV
ncbi:ras association domain-containing protein 10 [Drosophila subpulchrella]|uniref:ras association domain-containing protein 10 n=1 Tax=Drosophila subpulchrella TaxID=1486046 RepID=UPI0018A19C84|nr:ras association domain-containing protein 10 [Drosophila subpulchrella]XP_037722918.1 ras association domain-containing protein 10 [Drosophila subpulchrella]XP_037722919.1 ras association domain-containing protein 10 [Drosophila subpulchrella]XP_037722920.1 ras association domain-containing protein 10 [Drosophila subpulchrella]